MGLSTQQIAEQLNAKCIGNCDISISGVNTITEAGPDEVTFLANSKFTDKLKKSSAGAVLIEKVIEDLPITQILVENVEMALIEMLQLFAPNFEFDPGIDSTALIDQTARIGRNVHIGSYVTIAKNVEIGDNTVIQAGAKIGQNTKIGSDCRIDSNVVIYHNCTIGNSVIIQGNSTIGGTGFGYYFVNGQYRLVPHNGGVVIEDCVEIGANCSIDRAKFGNTKIGAGTKIDNFVHIAHNVVTGKNCIFAGRVGIAGSTQIGNGVVFGGSSGAIDNIKIGDDVRIAALGTFFGNAEAGKSYYGTPALESQTALRIEAAKKKLPQMLERIRKLEKRIEEFESAKDHKD